MAMEVSVLLGGHAIAGNRRGPRRMVASSCAHINFLKADSFAVAGTLYSGAGCFLSMTIQSKDMSRGQYEPWHSRH